MGKLVPDVKGARSIMLLAPFTSYCLSISKRFEKTVIHASVEEVFDPLSLKGLEQGVYKCNTVTKMPEADLVFLDKIFKANFAIYSGIIRQRLCKLYGDM
ncbi:hypothetical protein [Sporosarcina sp. G11-34]|uniref:hypothetical protein n=1 Tax=Sporosarcina sp. G11-34 TaxID=2849605 RepID=UPI0022A9D66D|nr:hypothetical protein [Sporosarcina sp. G11-34]